VSFCSVLPKKSVGSVIIGQVFENYQNVYSKNVYLNRHEMCLFILASVNRVEVLGNDLQTAVSIRSDITLSFGYLNIFI
jgi:hypothetical protein